MEWNTKWDWDNIIGFGSKAMDSPKKLQLADSTVVDDADVHNISGGSSAKSSVSASTDSSTKGGMQPLSSGNLSKKVELVSRNASAEAQLGLKLGKRTYFENSNGGTVKSTSFSVKKTKPSAQNVPLCCQVEGCNIDLSLAKDYHRKHRVCDSHSKCPKVIVGGCERRFCQQCSRFHALSEFDEKKRSCRKRLSDHNARRRKPQQETIQFDSTRLSTPFYGGNEQMSFVLNNSRLVHSTTTGNCAWDSGCNSKFTLSEGYPLKSSGGTAKQLHFPGMKTPQSIINMQNGILPSQNSTSLLSDPGSKGPMISPLDVAAPSEYRRALSLLSSNSWDSCEPDYIPLHHQMQENNSGFVQPEGVPLSFSDFWLSEQHSTQHPHALSLSTNSNFQEIQLFKTPYGADFYPNILN